MNTPQTDTNPPRRPTARERMTKALAVLGFLALLAALAWIIFTTVAMIPHITASVADLLRDQETDTTVTLDLSTSPDTFSPGEVITISWPEVSTPGTFAVAFTCEPDIAIQLRTPEFGSLALECDRLYNIGDLTTIDLLLETTTSREKITLAYQVAFIPETNPTDIQTTVGQLEVRGTALDDETVADLTEEPLEEVIAEPTTEEEEAVVVSPPTVPSQPAPSQPPVSPTEPTVTIPVSDPAGFTDVGVRFVSAGTLDSQQNFRPSGNLPPNTTGAIRFAVKNTGTRTSEPWTYTAELPNGQTYRSPSQSPLRPNEEATLTLGFRTGPERGWQDLTIRIETLRDSNQANHSINWRVDVR